MTRRQRGLDAEQWASDYLQERGLRLLERNYRCRRGEIDLIMQDAETLVFVEVRYRRGERFGGALASVDGAKRAKLIICAQRYLQSHAWRCPARFDVIAIGAEQRIDWVRNAFET